MSGHLRIVLGSIVGVPSCDLMSIDYTKGPRLLELNLRIRLKNCQAGIITSFRRVPRRCLSYGLAFSSPKLDVPSSLATKRSWMMLGARGLALRGRKGDDTVGEEGNESVSTVSTWKACAFVESSDSVERVELTVVRLSRCRLTSILLLKYVSKQSSSVVTFPSWGSGGIATSRSLSLINLWSSVASSLPVWNISILSVRSGRSNFSVMNVNASEASC